jgi:uncharacterized peroxidase-related enzyme
MEKYSMTNFTTYTPNNAPEKSREVLKNWQEKLGFVPNILGIAAESPAFLRGYDQLWSAVDRGTLSPAEREIVHITVSSLNNAGYCIAAHTTIGEKAGIQRDILEALRKDQPLKDKKQEELRSFTRNLMKKLGRVDQKDLESFTKAGYTKAQVMEVVLIASYAIMTNYLGHIVEPQLDKPFEANRVESGNKGGKSAHAA